LRTRGKGVNFSRLYTDVFYGQPLICKKAACTLNIKEELFQFRKFKIHLTKLISFPSCLIRLKNVFTAFALILGVTDGLFFFHQFSDHVANILLPRYHISYPTFLSILQRFSSHLLDELKKVEKDLLTRASAEKFRGEVAMKNPRPRNSTNKPPIHFISVGLGGTQGMHSGLTSNKRCIKSSRVKSENHFWRNIYFLENIDHLRKFLAIFVRKKNFTQAPTWP